MESGLPYVKPETAGAGRAQEPNLISSDQSSLSSLFTADAAFNGIAASARHQVKPGAQIVLANRHDRSDHGNVPPLNPALLKAKKAHV
jgi:hypothetical protein